MNLSPEWSSHFTAMGHEAKHWSEVGNPSAPDEEIMQLAQLRGYIVFTHDLDFGTLLAATQAEGPSVLQIRTQNVSPEYLKDIVMDVIERFSTELSIGALIVVDEYRNRVRLLPLSR